ncbi:NADPH-dependent F420 reductase [Marinobacter sp. JSM 1782161]|uniref:NADPH-dependent F420 reductase n=1 Tax=Marinobacter sp. JSM 1782161 TaxID=2685906 RepID=UPI0014021814|nr:NADPH-dependent F420 reductase [Marinobacter sp. JSM 1782161]
MKITVVGYGNIGAAVTKQLAKAGHDVIVSGRDLDKARAVAEEHGAKVLPLSETGTQSEAYVLAVYFEAVKDVLASIGDVSGKILIDPTNPLTADFMGLTVGHSTSAAEEIAKLAPGAKVVKAFNTLFAQVIDAGADFGGTPAAGFVAGDDADAKVAVAGVLESLGYAPIDAGGLVNARYLEPVAGLNIYLGYGAGLGTQIAPTWIKR